MDEFLREMQTLERIIYKSKNSHRSSLYFRKMVHVKRLTKKVVESGREGKKIEHLLKNIQEACIGAYIALSSCIGVGHYVGFSIGTMAVIAKIFSLSFSLIIPKREVEEEEESSSNISDIFSKL